LSITQSYKRVSCVKAVASSGQAIKSTDRHN